MAGFGRTDGPQNADEDVIVLHLGHLSEERYNKVVESVIAFMNTRWPDLTNVGIDS
jgi:hypothetical protein